MRKLKRLCHLSRRELEVFVGAVCLLPVTRLSLAMFGYRRTRRYLERTFPIAPVPLQVIGAAPLESFANLRGVRVQADSGRPAEAGDHEIVRSVPAERAFRMVCSAAAYGPFQTTCLPRSLVLWALLRREGMSPELRFGARIEGGAFEAHAWVGLGAAVLDPSIGRGGTFVPFEMRATLG